MFPSFEALESRVLFAANVFEAGSDAAAGVTASIRKGALVVRGDAAGNELSLTPDPSGGLKLDGGQSTTINGQPTAVFTGVSRGIRIGLGDGDDRLTVTGLIPPGNLSVEVGRGADEVSFQSAGVQGSLRILGNSGSKTVELTSSAVGGRTVVATGTNDDGVTLADSTFGGRVTVRTGGGNDSVLQESTFNGGVRVKDGPGQDAVSITKAFDFRHGEQGWVAGFADYPAMSDTQFYQFQSGLRPLPQDLNTAGTGFLLGGANRSDDLFMFLKRRLGTEDGVVAAGAYQVQYNITFASNAPSNSVGIGGAPGEGVFLKAGASAIEPMPVSDDHGDLRMNVDKGQQSNGGPAASVAGNIANGIEPQPYPSKVPYVSLTRAHVHPTPVTANRNGQLWLLVGTDSGYEGVTELYYQRIEVTLVRASVPIRTGRSFGRSV